MPPPAARLSATGICTAVGGPYDLVLAPTETVMLYGPSGSGKTLLLRAIADLDPHHGEARLDGLDARDLRPWEWRRAVGYCPAEPCWWRERVADHMASDCTAALHALGFADDVLGWSVVRLSSGERQRLAIARMLCNRPRVLLLDEPTANLDASNAERVEALVRCYRRNSGAAVLWVSHDRAQRARIGDRTYRVDSERLHPEPP